MSEIPIPDVPGKIHRDQVLAHEVQPYEDPECVCEPEPRWIRYRDEIIGQAAASEWEAIERSPNAEL